MDVFEEQEETVGELPTKKPPAKSSKKQLMRQGSVSENFFAVKGCSLIVPRQTTVVTENMEVLKQYGGELQTHLRAIFHQLRPQDNIKLAARLESWKETHRRYLVVVSTTGRQDTEESILVGCDFEDETSGTCTIGMVLPVLCDTSVKLDGDGGFHVERRDCVNGFKPVSVQALWSALQTINRCVAIARKNNYYEGSLYLTWVGFYSSKITSHRVYINEWNHREVDAHRHRKTYFDMRDPERIPVENLIRKALKKVMMNADLDNVTSRQIRRGIESEMDMDLRDYKEYIDSEMIEVCGQMDCSSKILDYLYLGSEWNANHLEELESLGITHILNVTMEIDNFFLDDFIYKNVQLYDEVESNLLPHWNHTWKFIDSARKSGGKCFVHCKMGVSRSASTVAAYLMKEKLWSKNKALEYVKSCRPIISPNSGFLRQLEEYEGIVFASAQRHNKLFRSRSENSLVDTDSDYHPSPVRSPRPPPTPAISVDDDGHDVTVDGTVFDLNRHLLDVACLTAPKVSRPKSWSPDQGIAPYVPDISENMNHSVRDPNSSEPVELLTPASDDSLRKVRVQHLRKQFTSNRATLRRQDGEAVPPLDDVAGSGDSVFAHNGASTFVHGRKTSSNKKTGRAPRTSSPAALGSQHIPVPMLDPVDTDSNDQTQDQAPAPQTSQTTEPTTVEEHISPSTSFSKGHHKTSSLPPPVSGDTQTSGAQGSSQEDEGPSGRPRCSSETPSVRKIVTAFESRLPEDDVRPEFLRRCASLPSGRRKTSHPVVDPSNLFSPTESIPENLTKEENPNSDAPCQVSRMSGQASSFNSNRNNNINRGREEVYSLSDDVIPEQDEHPDEEMKSHFTQDLLHAIRQVGGHWMAVENKETDVLASSTDPAPTGTPSKKRGLVLGMVRQIEKGLRKLTRQASTSSQTDSPTKQQPYCDVTSGDVNYSTAGSAGTSSVAGEQSMPKPTSDHNCTKMSRAVQKDLSEFITPLPYHVPCNSASSSGAADRRMRRTQSDRSGLKPPTFRKPGYFRSLRLTDSDPPVRCFHA